MIFPEMINLFSKSIKHILITILIYYNEMEHNDHVLRVVVESTTIGKYTYFKIFLTIRLENFLYLIIRKCLTTELGITQVWTTVKAKLPYHLLNPVKALPMKTKGLFK